MPLRCSRDQFHPDVGAVVDAVVGEGDDLETEFAVEVDGAGQGGVRIQFERVHPPLAAEADELFHHLVAIAA